jgi:hypothetical protein
MLPEERATPTSNHIPDGTRLGRVRFRPTMGHSTGHARSDQSRRRAISPAALVWRHLIFLDRALDGGLSSGALSTMPTSFAGVPLMW